MGLLQTRVRAYLADLLVVLGVITAVGLLWFVLFSAKSPIAFIIGMQRVINQKERFLLHKVDHHRLAQELRNFAEQHHWHDADFVKDDPELPPFLRSLEPSSVYIRTDHIIVDFGGLFDAMDIRAFKPGVEGYGTKKLGDGLWCYARGGSGPSE
jgi:hypothetical protein